MKNIKLSKSTLKRIDRIVTSKAKLSRRALLALKRNDYTLSW
jgi:hypothetical protein